MAEHITVRFMESERYDPMVDAEVVRFLAITNRGTFHAEVPVVAPASLRTRRMAFKNHVLEALDAGEVPCEVML